MGKEYVGRRLAGGVEVVVREDGTKRPLGHVVLHSPTGLEWGYGGQGPADLALSILADYFGETARIPAPQRKNGLLIPNVDAIERTRAWQWHRLFLWEVIVSLPRQEFALGSNEIASWLRRHGA